MRTLAGDGFSTAIFGPAWTYEHFSTFPNGNTMPIAKAVHRSMWEGFALPEELNCDCHKDRAHHSTDYRSNPIVNSARQYPAGSSLFLETNFSPAFAFKTEQRNVGCLPFHFREQDLFTILIWTLLFWLSQKRMMQKC